MLLLHNRSHQSVFYMNKEQPPLYDWSCTLYIAHTLPTDHKRLDAMSKQTELTVLGNTREDHSDQKHQHKLSDIDK